MFGVDSSGNDTLTPQFRGTVEGKTGSQKIIRPGSDIDLQISTDGFYRFFSQQPSIRESALLNSLIDLMGRGIIKLNETDYQVAIEQILQREMNHFRDLRARTEENRALLIAGSSLINGDALASQMQEDRHFRPFEEAKHLRHIQSVYTDSHPEVLELAILLAYGRGKFAACERMIIAGMDKLIREMAIERAKASALEKATVASRSGIIRVAAG